MTPLTPGQTEAFRAKIRAFYREHGRSFPWRETHDPYKILVSEMMLQQTQTARVVPKYGAWLARFPTARALAGAPLADVLAAWSGLGYNRRARFLQQACAQVCARFGGEFPHTAAELRSLPGIGAYTAGAVSAFAFGNPEVFIETNIRSVFIHEFFQANQNNDEADSAQNPPALPPDSAPHAEKIPDSEILPLVAQTLDAQNPREWYYALMDYGAELKRKLPNPSRRSRSYARQGAFKGSFREARGAIVRQLSQNGAQTLAQIAAAEGIDHARLEAAAEKLIAEKLICAENGGYRIW